MSKPKTILLGLFAVQLLAAPPVRAAGNNTHRYSVSGNIKDALGRPLGNVHLLLKNQAAKTIDRAVTDKEGHFKFREILPGSYAVVAGKSGFKTAVMFVNVTSAGAQPLNSALQAEAALNLEVVAQRLNRARNRLSPTTGGSSYTFTQKAIQQLPQGNNTPLNQVLLQAPGVVQDSYGQIHVRGDHADLQYRIDGVQLPEGIVGFANTFSTRFIQSVSLLDGALPAEFGYRTAGIVDIHTRTGEIAPGGDVEFYGGQRGTVQPSFDYGGTAGNFSYFMTGQYFRTTRGVEPPTPGPSPVNDTTDQGRAFGDFSYFLNPTTRITFLTGSAVSNIQIPANSDQPPAFKLAGIPYYPSIDVSERQFEQNYFNVLALQGVIGPKLNYQISAFSRYSAVHFDPDDIGDLIYNGAASNVDRTSFVNGLQADASYHLDGTNTIRSGFHFSGENAYIGNHELVFPEDPATGMQSSTVPERIADNRQITDWLYGGYLQDEWHPTERLTINFGARFDLDDAFVRATQCSPRAGVVYKLPTQTTLHAGYARYFTPPQTEVVTDVDIKKFKNTTGEPPTLQNNLPAPDRSHYFDAGVTQRFGKSINLGIDSYYKISTDLLDEGQFGPALVFTPINYAKGRVYGVEATGSYDVAGLYAYGNFAYSAAQGEKVVAGQVNFTPDELAYIADHYISLDHDQTFTASVGTAYHWKGFMFTVDSLYASGLRRGFANTGNMLPYFIVNAGITKDFVVPKAGPMQVRVSVVNLFDHTYQIRNGTGIGVFAAQYGERRAVYGGLKWQIPSLGQLFGKPSS
ncbi:MAG: TonB-dependent receptor [Candidatus Binataceae bacterium]